MIEVRNLTKRYGDLTAIRDVSFTVARGETLGFLGPNGAGKTTTMRILTGFMPASDRTVILSTHILPEVSQICEKVVILSAGRIALEERMETLLKQGVSLEDVFLQAISKEEAQVEEAEEVAAASGEAT